jgi:hypothetical protein
MSTKADPGTELNGRLMTGPCPIFEPETIRAMHMAFEEACDPLRLTHRRAPSDVVVANIVAELAKSGEHDSRQLASRVAAGCREG